MKKFYDENRWIALSLIVLISISFLFWRFDLGIEQDFGLNLFTEIIGVIVTVIIIDVLYKKREERRNIPLKLVIFKDVRLVFRTYMAFFIPAYRSSVPKEQPKEIKDFLSKNEKSLVMKFLDINSIRPHVTPDRTWLSDLYLTKKNIISSTEKILTRYEVSLSPDLYKAIHTLNNGRFLKQIDYINVIDKRVALNHVNGSKSMDFYAIDFSEEELDSLRLLQKWLDENHKVLKKYEVNLNSYAYLNEHIGKQNLDSCMPLKENFKTNFSIKTD